MSEHQSYEFLAIDRPLTATQQAELRAISTRAEISSSRFWNEYQWGSLKAVPDDLVARYFDAHLYLTNFGTTRLILRLPVARTDPKALEPYFNDGDTAVLRVVDEHVVLDFTSDTDEPEYEEQRGTSLAAFVSLRAELMRGDLRPAYLAWLLAVTAGDVDDDADEPPVPPGLAEPSAAQVAMIELLRIDADLVAAAASDAPREDDDRPAFRRWLLALPGKQKDAWLARAADDPELPLGGELLRVFRSGLRSRRQPAGRTVGELRGRADGRRAEREEAEARWRSEERAAAAAARKRRLTALARDLDGAWAALEGLVEASRYDEAIARAADLLELAGEQGAKEGFDGRFEALRKRQIRRRGFFDRWKRRR